MSITARSSHSERPTTRAFFGSVSPPTNTCSVAAPATMWLFVTAMPLGSMMNADPSPARSSSLPTSGSTKSPSETMRTVPCSASASDAIAVPTLPCPDAVVGGGLPESPPLDATTMPPITSAATTTPAIAMSGPLPLPFCGAAPAGTPGSVSRLGELGGGVHHRRGGRRRHAREPFARGERRGARGRGAPGHRRIGRGQRDRHERHVGDRHAERALRLLEGAPEGRRTRTRRRVLRETLLDHARHLIGHAACRAGRAPVA